MLSINSIKKNKIIHNILVLFSGNFVAQLLTIFSAPILSRIYDPESFGIYGLFTSVISVLIVIASLRYEQAIVLPKENEKAINILALSFGILLVFTFLYFSLTIIFKNQIGELLNSNEIIPFLWLVPISIFVLGTYNIMNFWLIRSSDFQMISSTTVIKSLSMNGSQFFLGITSILGNGLIYGQLFSHILTMLYILPKAFSQKTKKLYTKVSLKKIKEVGQEHFEFVKYGSPQVFINSLSQNIPYFFWTAYYGLEVVGVYLLANRLFQVPISMIGKAINNVLFKHYSDQNNAGNSIYSTLKKSLSSLFLIGLIPCLIVILYGNEMFVLLLGESWGKVGVYAQFMAPWMLMLFANSGIIAVIYIHKLQKFYLIYDILGLVLRVLVIIASGLFLADTEAVFAYSMVGFLLNLYLMFYVLRKVKLLK